MELELKDYSTIF